MVKLEADALDGARGSLVGKILSAASLTEINAASQALGQRLVDHPDEPGRADGFELLSHRDDFAREREVEYARSAEAVFPPLARA